MHRRDLAVSGTLHEAVGAIGLDDHDTGSGMAEMFPEVAAHRGGQATYPTLSKHVGRSAAQLPRAVNVAREAGAWWPLRPDAAWRKHGHLALQRMTMIKIPSKVKALPSSVVAVISSWSLNSRWLSGKTRSGVHSVTRVAIASGM